MSTILSPEMKALFAKKYHDRLLRDRAYAREYRLSPEGKQKEKVRALRYYYKKNDLYHPELNPKGSIERKYKRSE